jgi:hypothetical protein
MLHRRLPAPAIAGTHSLNGLGDGVLRQALICNWSLD